MLGRTRGRVLVVGALAVGALTLASVSGRTVRTQASPPTPSAQAVLAMDVAAQANIVDLLLFEATDSGQELRHRRSVDGAVTWRPPTTVERNGRAIVGHHRGMDPQIASSGDTIVVMWTVPGATEWGDGPLATAVSRDGGKSWASGGMPNDDGATRGHSFLELSADPDGVFYAFWLDARDGPSGLRSATSKDGGLTWSSNVSIDTRTCECCWNKSVALSSDTVAVLYRDIDPRDMALAVSERRGPWTRRGSVGAFGWAIDGCPHVGGGLARTTAGATEFFHAVVWTGAEGHVGVHVLRSSDGGQHWSPPKKLGSERAKNTDLAAAGSNVAIVWDEARKGESAVFGVRSSDNGATWSEPVRLSGSGRVASHPLVVWTGGRFLAFWTERLDTASETLRWQKGVLDAAP